MVIIDNFAESGREKTSKVKKCNSSDKHFGFFRKLGKPKLIKTDHRQKFFIEFFHEDLTKQKKTKLIHDIFQKEQSLQKDPTEPFELQETIVFENKDSNWVDLSDKINKNYFNTFHSSNKVTPFHSSLRRNQSIVKENVRVKRKEVKMNIEESDRAETNSSGILFSKNNSTNLFCKLYSINDIINYIVLCYRIHSLLERSYESFFEKNQQYPLIGSNFLRNIKNLFEFFCFTIG